LFLCNAAVHIKRICVAELQFLATVNDNEGPYVILRPGEELHGARAIRVYCVCSDDGLSAVPR
jgi:hypothetical protein